ncbi:hypothetical protein, partial [Shigella flexneri]|uniref:hypothetical protein n=6 Tax=Enterobacterales TaxID=91347 RepID=UPI001C0A8985
IFRNRFDGFGFKLRRVTLGFSAHYWLLLMPFYFRKECPLNSGYLNSRLGNISPAAFRIKYYQMTA